MPLAELGTGWQARIERIFGELGMPPQAALVADFSRLLDLVVAWNAKVDLTAARDADELADLFFADAVVVARASATPGQRWVDVGSGAGAPGLPLALLMPEVGFTLIEPKAKRVAFLRTALGSLGRADVVVERGRSEALRADGYDVAISRATLGPKQWLNEGARLATRAIWVLLARADVPSLEGWVVDHDESYVWPLTGSARRAVRFVCRVPS